MKRLLSYILLVLFFLSLVFTPAILSQEPSEFDYNRAYRDYIYNFDVYRNANIEYEAARAQYLKFKTLKSQQDAYDATLAMLKARDEAVRTYLTALRMKLRETEGVPFGSREVQFSLIDSEVAWFAEHRETLPSAGTLEDLAEDSDEAKDRYGKIVPLFYETLITVSLGKVANIRDAQSKVLDKVRDKVLEIKNEENPEYKFEDRKIQIIERWILEVENRFSRSEEKEQEGLSIIGQLKEGKRKGQEFKLYNQAQFRSKESAQFLKEANPFLAEIIKEIKTESDSVKTKE